MDLNCFTVLTICMDINNWRQYKQIVITLILQAELHSGIASLVIIIMMESMNFLHSKSMVIFNNNFPNVSNIHVAYFVGQNN